MKKLAIIAGFLSVFACEEPYKFDKTEPVRKELIVSGQIDDLGGPYYVELSWTRVSSRENTSVSFACVELFDSERNFEDCYESSPGKYRCDGLVVRGIPGRSYYVQITLDNGWKYRSDPDPLAIAKPAAPVLSWREGIHTHTSAEGIDVDSHVIYFSMETDIPQAGEEYYHYTGVNELYQFLQKRQIYPFQPPPPCYMVKSVANGSLELVNGMDLTSTGYELRDFVYRTIDDSFLRKHVFTGSVQSISKPYYQYLRQVENLTEGVGSIFDTPKGIPKGNIHSITDPTENVHGFFRAVSTTVQHIAIWPDDIQANVRDQCNSYRQSTCYECESLGGTFERPELFDLVN